jgi:hypothetical protein
MVDPGNNAKEACHFYIHRLTLQSRDGGTRIGLAVAVEQDIRRVEVVGEFFR